MIPSGKLVIDTSVVVKWYVPEIGATQAGAILDRGHSLLAPELLVAELGNVLWKKVRRGELGQAEAEEIADAFVATAPVALKPTLPLLRPAFDIAIRYQRTVYDALFLATALAEGCPLVTADARLGQSLAGTVLASAVLVLHPQ